MGIDALPPLAEAEVAWKQWVGLLSRVLFHAACFVSLGGSSCFTGSAAGSAVAVMFCSPVTCSARRLSVALRPASCTARGLIHESFLDEHFEHAAQQALLGIVELLVFVRLGEVEDSVAAGAVVGTRRVELSAP